MKVGFLGAGNMGKAIIDGLLNTNAFTNENIKVVINSDICNIPQTYDKHKKFFKKGIINYKIIQKIFKNNL